MNKDKKVGRIKPKLLIQFEDLQNRIEEFKKEQRFNEVDLKPLRSVKNLHQIKQFHFSEQVPQVCQTARKLQQLKKLEEDKVNLIRSLKMLKESAVSAIAQKQDEITKLKLRTNCIQDQNIEIYEQRLIEQKQMRKTLEQQKNDLLKQLKYERQLHFLQLEEKENLIEQLCAEITQIRTEIEILQQNYIAKNKKIKLLQQENSQLSEQLETSSIATALKQRSEHFYDLDQTIKEKPTLSLTNSIQTKKYYSYIETSDHFFQSKADKSYINEVLQKQNKAHKEQLLELRSFYEKRIASIRQIYIRQLNLPTESSQTGSVIRKRNSSNSSNSKSYEGNESKKQIEGLNLHTKEMYSIEENVEKQLQTSRTNLKNQIRMQNLSQCPSVQQRCITNQDTESQFTTKYFEIPYRFLKKNQSSDSITITHDGDFKVVRKKTYKQAQSSKNCSKKRLEVELTSTPESQISKKSIFGAGLLSGVVFTTFLGFVFSKKSFSLK